MTEGPTWPEAPVAERQSPGAKSVAGRRDAFAAAAAVAVLVVTGALVSLLAAANVVAFAALTGSVLWAAVGGLLAAVVTAWVARLLLRRGAGSSRWSVIALSVRHPVVGPALLLGCAGLLSISWLCPGSGTVQPQRLPGTAWVDRPDGSRLAVHVTRATQHASQPPVVVVHGGPGVADMEHDVPAFAALATDRDVYLYDQAGTGASTRLADPMQYTMSRAVADLEAVRVATGSQRVVLLSHSWGARIALRYLQQHPGRVSKLVLSAPDDLSSDGQDPPPGDLTTRLDAGQRTWLYLRLLRPRNLFTYALTLFCEDRPPREVGTDGVGYYAHYVPELHPEVADVAVDVPRLARMSVPTLVIKPACDYLPWPSGYSWLPDATLVLLPDAGHAAYLERPNAYFRLVHAFLSGNDLPLPPVQGSGLPDGYRGTR